MKLTTPINCIASILFYAVRGQLHAAVAADLSEPSKGRMSRGGGEQRAGEGVDR